MPTTITAPLANVTVPEVDSNVIDPVRVYSAAYETATYEMSLSHPSAYVITSQGDELSLR